MSAAFTAAKSPSLPTKVSCYHSGVGEQGQSEAGGISYLLAALSLGILLIAGCYNPKIAEGLACSESGKCPSNQSCSDGICVIDSAGRPDADPTTLADAALGMDASDGASGDGPACASPGSQTFDFTGSLHSFVVPECVTTLTIDAFGAAGGGSVGDATAGGEGARMRGDFAVSSGETFQILVGGRGIDASSSTDQSGGSGGGGSFVVRASASAVPLLAAGGGGGATDNSGLNPGGNGQIVEAGQGGGIDDNGGSGGLGGGTHVTQNAGHGGTGAGGFSTSGVGESIGDASFGTTNKPGTAFVNGGAGGVGGSLGRSGGFGGGGSAGFTGGGGGGYSGGGSSGIAGTIGGGGGGSINAGTNQANEIGVRVGNGQVIVSWTL